MSGIDFGYVYRTLGVIGRAVPYTLLIAAVSGVLGLLLGLAVAVIRGKGAGFLYRVFGVYVSFFRSTPCIIHIFLIYYGIPAVVKNIYPAWEDSQGRTFYAVLALVLYNGAHMSEFIRPAYLSVGKGQLEAADSIGMGAWKRFSRIVFPQMLPVAMPNVENAMIEMVKDTSILYMIGLTDIMGRAKKLIANDFGVKKLEVYIAAAVLYWVIIFAIARGFRLLSRKCIKEW